jgi:hypothetical protein
MSRLKPKLHLILILPLVFIQPTGSWGLERPTSCKIPHKRTALVTKIYKDGLLQLESGEIVRLIGVMPVKFINNPTSTIAKRLNKLAKRTIEVLRHTVKGKMITLAYSGKMHDRYDHLLAHVYGPDNRWLQGILLRAGLVRSFSYRNNRACIQEMLALEIMARRQKHGLWRYHTFQPLQASRLKKLLQKRYRFTLVEGKVRKVATVKSWTFLNFGENWRNDFTIAIKRKYKKNIERNGLDLNKLEGRNIRVRGWIENWNGPLIKVTHSQQIEVLETK